MKSLLLIAMCVLMTGCMVKPKKDESKPATVAPTAAAAPVPAAGSGVTMPGGPGGGVVTGGIDDLGAPARANPPPTTPAATSPTTTPSFPQEPGKLVDAREALQNKKIVVSSGKITGEDPLTAAAQAYFSVRARAQILNFKHQVNLTRESTNDGKPLSTEQFMELVRMMKIEFMHLPPWQMMGYDSKTGEIMVLEDKAQKISIYKQRGIPIEDADKPYDVP